MSFFIVQTSEDYTAITVKPKKNSGSFSDPVTEHLQLWQKEASAVLISLIKQRKNLTYIVYVGFSTSNLLTVAG
jgi:hypothetical protein